MTREDAVRKVKALRAVTVDRGATEGEAATAKRLAEKLVHTYRLDRMDPPRARSRTPPRPPRATWQDLDDLRQAFSRMHGTRMRAEEVLRGFQFDPTTGKAGPGVKVHRYNDQANWKIELFPPEWSESS